MEKRNYLQNLHLSWHYNTWKWGRGGWIIPATFSPAPLNINLNPEHILCTLTTKCDMSPKLRHDRASCHVLMSYIDRHSYAPLMNTRIKKLLNGYSLLNVCNIYPYQSWWYGGMVDLCMQFSYLRIVQISTDQPNQWCAVVGCKKTQYGNIKYLQCTLQSYLQGPGGLTNGHYQIYYLCFMTDDHSIYEGPKLVNILGLTVRRCHEGVSPKMVAVKLCSHNTCDNILLAALSISILIHL